MSWPLVSIEEFCATGSGGTPSRKVPDYYTGDIPWIKSGDLREKEILQATEFISKIAVEKSSAKIVNKGTILLAMYGATVGRMAMLGLDAATNQAVCSISPIEGKAFPKYVYYALLNKMPDFLKNAVGGAQPNISQRMIKQTKIPLPPLEEQKRIAAILDKADAIRCKRQQAIKLTDQFLRSVFLDMFGDPVTNPKEWEKQSIEHLSTRVTKGESPKWQGFDYQDQGVRFVTSENVLWGKLDDRKKYIPEGFHAKLSRSALKEDDLLINLVGASVGRTCLVPKDGVPANINQAVAVTTLVETKIIPEFLLTQILTESIQRELLGNVVDAARANISLKNIRELTVIVPPVEEQRKYLKAVEKVATLNDKYQEANELLLFESLTQQAFSGELTKQTVAA